jgi:predicted dehydrogenase
MGSPRWWPAWPAGEGVASTVSPDATFVTRLGFAGAGHISVVHGLAAQALPGVSVSRVASRRPEQAAERAGQLGAVACRYDELPGDADVVVVSTPPDRHVPDALAALSAGAAAIVEKPLATTLRAADELVAADEAAGHRTGYAENLAFAPIVLRAASLVRGLGPLRHVDARMLQGRPGWGDFLTEGWGGGVLFDLGAHPLAIVVLLADAGPDGTDRVERVRGRLEGEPDVPVDTHAEVDLVFTSGLHARVEASWRDPVAVLDFQAASDDGVVRAELLPHVALEHDGEGLALPAPRTSGADARLDQFGYLGQLEDLLADFADGRPPDMGPRFGRLILELTCAAYASAGNGSSEVQMPFTGDREATPLQLWRGH